MLRVIKRRLPQADRQVDGQDCSWSCLVATNRKFPYYSMILNPAIAGVNLARSFRYRYIATLHHYCLIFLSKLSSTDYCLAHGMISVQWYLISKRVYPPHSTISYTLPTNWVESPYQCNCFTPHLVEIYANFNRTTPNPSYYIWCKN